MGERKLVRKKFRALEEAHRQIEKANEAARKLGERGHYAGHVAEENKALRKAGGGLKVDPNPAAHTEHDHDGVTE